MSAHDLPDTPELRAQMKQSTEVDLTALGLDATTVALWEDGYRAAQDAAHTFEWWYFDVQMDDASTLVVTFSNKPHTDPHGPVTPGVLVIYHGPDGTKRRVEKTYLAEEFSASTVQCDVRIGPNTVRGDLTHYEMHLEVDDLVIDLTLERQAPSWRPGAGYSYFKPDKTEYLAWVVPVPYGTVEATIVDAGTTRTVTGSAYHDHNWGNQLMSAMLDHWFWGRAHIGDYTVVYVRMTTKGVMGLGSINIPTFLLANSERVITDDMLPLRLELGDEVPGPGHQTYPSSLTWVWRTDAGSVTMTVTNPVMIEALDMHTDRPGLNPRGLRGALEKAFEHPMYYDFNADMELAIDLAGITETVTGRTLYEKMMFR